MIITELYQLLFGKSHLKDGNVIDMSEHGRVGGVSTGQGFKHVSVIDSSGSIVDSFGGGADIDLYQTNDIDDGDTSTDITYIGLEDKDGNWCIKKIDSTTSTLPTFQYATVTNNAGTTTYSSAWTDRASLNYADYSSVF